MSQHEQFPDPAEIRHSIGTHGSFSLATVSGDIRLRGSDGNEAVVIARSGRGRQDLLPLSVRRGEGMLHIELDQRGAPLFGWMGRGRDDVEFDVTLPRGARVDINAVSGDLDIQGLLGEQGYRTVSGDVTIVRGGGRVSVTTVSGDVELFADETLEPHVSTTSGDCEIAAPLVRALHVRTVSGDAEVRGSFDTGAMHAIESVSGDVDIEAMSGLTVEVRKGIDLSGGSKQRVVGDGAARLRFRSLSGDLHLAGSGEGRKARESRTAADVPLTPPAPAGPSSLEILQALERGEIDVEEAQRRLEGAGSHG